MAFEFFNKTVEWAKLNRIRSKFWIFTSKHRRAIFAAVSPPKIQSNFQKIQLHLESFFRRYLKNYCTYVMWNTPIDFCFANESIDTKFMAFGRFLSKIDFWRKAISTTYNFSSKCFEPEKTNWTQIPKIKFRHFWFENVQKLNDSFWNLLIFIIRSQFLKYPFNKFKISVPVPEEMNIHIYK